MAALLRLGRLGRRAASGPLRSFSLKATLKNSTPEVGKFSNGSDLYKKIKHVFPWFLLPFEFVAHFIMYIIEEGSKAIGIDYMFGWIVIVVAGLLSWELKGTPFRQRFVIEQPEDHMAHLTLKLIKENQEVTELLKDSIEMKLADHSSRILELENLTKSLKDTVKAMQKVHRKAEDEKAEKAEDEKAEKAMQKVSRKAEDEKAEKAEDEKAEKAEEQVPEKAEERF